MRLKQQGANFTCRFNALDVHGLRHHFNFILSTHVGHDSAANVHTFSNVKRQRASTFEDVDAGCPWQLRQGVDIGIGFGVQRETKSHKSCTNKG